MCLTFGQSSRRDTFFTSKIFLLRVCTIVVFDVVLATSRGEETDSSLRQQVFQLTAQQVQQGLHHLCTQLVCVGSAVDKHGTIISRHLLIGFNQRRSRSLPGADGQDLQQARGRHL